MHRTKPVVLNNLTCPYCGADLAEVEHDKEHVIGRRFVPKGSLHGAWNLIVRACRPCNRLKADLEDDISAISLQPDARGHFPRSESWVRIDAARKGAGSRSRVSGNAVAESSVQVEIEGVLAQGVRFRFSGTAPPQLADDRVFALARMHVAAFFYWITLDASRTRGGFWLGGYYPLLWSWVADWGNQTQRAFMQAVEAWPHRVMASTADGLFKLALRRHPASVCWSWALEWNASVRVIGFCGDEAAVETLVAAFPADASTRLVTEDGAIEMRTEARLAPADDCMFRWVEP